MLTVRCARCSDYCCWRYWRCSASTAWRRPVTSDPDHRRPPTMTCHVAAWRHCFSRCVRRQAVQACCRWSSAYIRQRLSDAPWCSAVGWSRSLARRCRPAWRPWDMADDLKPSIVTINSAGIVEMMVFPLALIVVLSLLLIKPASHLR